MTHEDNAAGVRISNWTLATNTKPGARYVYSPTPRSTASHVEAEAKASPALGNASRVDTED